MTFRRSYAPRPARWMDLKYAGRCCVCGASLAVGTRAFYDPADKTVTCVDLACCESSGLTREVWSGSPVSGSWIKTRAERRIGSFVRDPGEDAADRWNESHA